MNDALTPTWKTYWRRLREQHLHRIIGGALAALFLGMFLKLTSELRENELSPMDQSILSTIARARTPGLTQATVNITALGSDIVLGLISAAGLCIFLFVMKDRQAALQLALASSGAGFFTRAAKHWIGRDRPDVLQRLVSVDGFSYPSGHSLTSAAIYLTLALLACKAVHWHRQRVILMSIALVLIGLIGFSRIYLGVHYPSDVLSGLLLGASWALALAALCRPLAAGGKKP